jgi:hypothetical protein
VWDPEKARTLPGYPKSPAAYEAMRQRNRETIIKTHAAGRISRMGVPDGWSGRRKELAEVRRVAATEARQMVGAVRHTALDNIVESDRERAEIALVAALEICRDPSQPARLRIAAARVALGFLIPHASAPASASEGEEWLGELAVAAGVPRTPGRQQGDE